MNRAGKRRKHIAVQQHNGNTVDGQPTYHLEADWEHFNDLRELPASFESTNGGESVRGRKVEADASAIVTVLDTPRTRAITPKMRFIIQNRTFNILSGPLDLEGDERELMFTVRERT